MRLLFGRTSGAATNDGCQEAVLTVNVDGSDVRQVVAPGPWQLGPLSWSPDGSSILIGTSVIGLTDGMKRVGGDIYTVRSDGTGLRQLTSDGVSYGPSWTRDERIVFIRWLSPTDHRGDQWVIDADGGNAKRVETALPC